MDAEEPAVGDRARVRDGELARARPSTNDARRAIPHDPRPQLRELVRGIAPGEHVEHVLELRAREIGERVGALHELVQLVDRDLLVGADRDDLLRDDVEGIPRDARLLDRALAHRLRHHRRFEQVGAELGEDAPARDRREVVTGASDPLEPARDRLRALDLDHEVDRAHVDPELERGGRDQAWDLPRLEQLLDEEALLARERAVVRARDLLLRELVQPQGEALGEPAVVDEDDRRAVLPDELEDRRDRSTARSTGSTAPRPDPICDAVGKRRHREVRGRAELAHVLERNDDLEVELLPRAGVDELDVTARARDEAADLGQRTLSRREADALERPLDERLQPLEREREMRSALRPGDGVHLVEDHGLDPAQVLARLRGEEQEERLRGRDEDVGRRLQHPPPLLGRRVAGAYGDAELRAQTRERPAQIPLDVVVQRLQRRDVEEPQPFTGRVVQPVDPDEERGERLPRPGRRLDEDMPSARDRRPAGALRGRRPLERALEPGSRSRGEDVESSHEPRVTSSIGHIQGEPEPPPSRRARARARSPTRGASTRSPESRGRRHGG